MHAVLRVLSVLSVFVYADSQLISPSQVINRELQLLPRMLPHSSAVLFFRYGETDPFKCEQPGYFPDVKDCRYYYQCVKSLLGLQVRYVFQCIEDRVYDDRNKRCAKADDSDGVTCSEQHGNRATQRSNVEEQDKTLKETTHLMDDEQNKESTDQIFLSTNSFETESSENLDLLLFTDTPRLPPFSNEMTETTTDSSDLMDVISITASDESEFSSEETYSDEDSTEESNSNYDTAAKQDSTKFEAIGNEQPECVDEGFFADSENCSKFYRCVPFGFKLIKYEFSCPRGTIWDDSLKTCNFRAMIWQINCRNGNEDFFPFVQRKAVHFMPTRNN